MRRGDCSGSGEGREWAGSRPEINVSLQPLKKLHLAISLDVAFQVAGGPSRGTRWPQERSPSTLSVPPLQAEAANLHSPAQVHFPT